MIKSRLKLPGLSAELPELVDQSESCKDALVSRRESQERSECPSLTWAIQCSRVTMKDGVRKRKLTSKTRRSEGKRKLRGDR